MLKLISEHLRPFWGSLFLLGTLQVLSVAGSLYLPSLNARLIDDGVAQGDQGVIWKLGAWMLAISVTQLCVAGLAVWTGARISTYFGRDLRERLFSRVMRLDSSDIHRLGPSSLITRCSNDITQVQTLLLLVMTVLITAPLTMVGAIIMGLREDPGLAWLMAVAVPTLVGVIAVFAWLAMPGYRRMQVQIDRVNTVLREQMSGLRVTRVFTQEQRETERFNQANHTLVATSQGVGRLYLSLGPLVGLLMNLGVVAVIWFGGHRVSAGEIGIGSIAAFMTYLMQMMAAVLMSTSVVMHLPRAKVSAARVREVLETPIKGGECEIHDESSSGWPSSTGAVAATGLAARGLSVRLPGASQPVLHDVELTVRPGQHTAIVGSTGSGKSTLLNVLARQTSATEGQVTLDGREITSVPLKDVRRQIGVVPQKAFLFTGTIASNLRYGASNASDAELWTALEVAQAEDFVRALPEGLDAPVASGGGNFSGGQRQRLCIARALVMRPRFLLFDDAFSALDQRTEGRLRSSLQHWAKASGSLTVTQRLSTARFSDHIVVLERGRVVGQGTHDSLLDTCETYREFVASQSVEEELV